MSTPITDVLLDATPEQLDDAEHWVSDQLHVPKASVTNTVAVAYIIRHFQQGSYEGWDGWAEMRAADR